MRDVTDRNKRNPENILQVAVKQSTTKLHTKTKIS